MSFNNEVTYHEKWDTMSNNAALKQLDNKFFDRSICSPSCPVGWAPEVLKLLERIDKEFGIARNEETIRATMIQNTMFELFVKATFNSVKYSLTNKFDFKKRPINFKQRLVKAKSGVNHALNFAWKAFKVKKVNPIINKILRPKVTLSQVKEKYGYLTIYFNAPTEYKQYIDDLISNTVRELQAKGAYYTAQQLKRDNE